MNHSKTLFDNNFLELLRYALGIVQQFTLKPTPEEWQQLFVEAHRQSLVGVLFDGVNRLRGEQRPPMALTMQWAKEAETIRGLNQKLNAESGNLTRIFEAEGHETVILKGQANARLYPNTLSRQPGDIDIWLSGGKERIIETLTRLGMTDEKDVLTGQHHIELARKVNGIEVEAHYNFTSYQVNDKINNNVQSFLNNEISKVRELTEHGFRVPSVSFALVMQLCHIRHHMFGSGVGVRHLVDYWILLRNSTEEDRKVVSKHLKMFGLSNVAKGVMWIIREIFNEEDKLLKITPSRWIGYKILNKTVAGGNFGFYKDKQALANLSVWKALKLHESKQFNDLLFTDYCISNILRSEREFWGYTIKTMPARIRKRSLLLSR